MAHDKSAAKSQSQPTGALPAVTTLPLLAVSPVDVGRLIRELEAIEDDLLQSQLRTASQVPTPRAQADHPAQVPPTSRLLEQAAQLNQLDLLQLSHRAELRHFLEGVKSGSPVIHLSFSADPAPAFLEKLMAWLRREIHPVLLVTVGLQPTIGAGCLLRTTNKYFDFSLRQKFADKREVLQVALQLPASAVVAAVPASEVAT